jgi:peroxiredoxin
VTSRHFLALRILLLAALFVASCQRSPKADLVRSNGQNSSSGSAADPDAGLKPAGKRKPAPTFALKDAGGASVNLVDYKGKVVLVNFWATWCGPCKVEIPWFIEFQEKYKDRDFAVLGVSMDDDGWKSVKPYLAEHKINYPVVIGTQLISDQYGSIDSLPTSFMLDRQGRIAAIHIGLAEKSEYQDEITKLLADAKASVERSSGALLAAVPASRFRPGR